MPYANELGAYSTAVADVLLSMPEAYQADFVEAFEALPDDDAVPDFVGWLDGLSTGAAAAVYRRLAA